MSDLVDDESFEELSVLLEYITYTFEHPNELPAAPTARHDIGYATYFRIPGEYAIRCREGREL